MSDRPAAQILRLDEIESLPGPGTLRWIPVRHTLGIHAFGCNAYVAGEAGDDVVEPHTESPQDQEELYFVARGAATFTIDGETHEAPSGTYVFIPDPDSHRHAVAREAGTTVLSFGGPPTFTPSAWEWAFRASALMRSERGRARAIVEDGLRAHPEDPSLLYQLACAEALDGHAPAALDALGRAIAGRPEVADWARDDANLASLGDAPAFRALLAP
jgi:quercetin dioxygenase-like cupin family protein